MSRAGRRALGKRRLRREAHADVTKIVELSEAGRSPRVIASSVGLDEEFVREVLELSEAGRSPSVISSSVGLDEEFVREVLERAEAVRSEAGEGASVGRQM